MWEGNKRRIYLIKKINLLGFSFIELLIVISLLGFLILGSVSWWGNLITQNRSTTYVQQILTALQFARSVAIKQNEKVIFCPSQDHRTCGGEWRVGQIILVKNKVLKIYPALSNSDRLLWKSAFGKNQILEFLPTGFTNGQNGSFWYCPKNLSAAKRITLQQSGKARVSNEFGGC